ncbi:uncharacterized protein V1518DRAFT_373269 [Limtongia smithiae]|uniref:uncharacterized protein n=1 Tax=Limtongia smithiae TaxID=1125753 RepID=UPI0034CEC8F7
MFVEEYPHDDADPRWPLSDHLPAHPGLARRHVSHAANPHATTHTRATNTCVVRAHRLYSDQRDPSSTPAYLDVYPEYPLSAYIDELQFYTIVGEVNARLDNACYPLTWGNIASAVLGFFTGWISEWVYEPPHARQLRQLDRDLEQFGVGSGGRLRAVPLRESAYLSLDFEVELPHAEDREA